MISIMRGTGRSTSDGAAMYEKGQVFPGYAPNLNPDELAWRHTKRSGMARNPLRTGEKPAERVQVLCIVACPERVRLFFSHPSVVYISDC